MFRRARCNLLRATPVLKYWTAEDDDTTAPDTTFKNVKPSNMMRLWRQIRHRAWMLWVWDEEWVSWVGETYQYQNRMEQSVFQPTGAFGSVPGSYSDPLLYNTKSTSPFRWHSSPDNFEVVGHWYMESDEIQRLKEWAPKNPDDPFEMFPRPPRHQLAFEETVDEHGNRNFKYKYRYDYKDPHEGAYPAYPFSHFYGGSKDCRDRVEPYGFKQGELLRADKEEEEVIRRIMEEEDREWDRVKRTEIIQEPWYYPGKIRPHDLMGSVDRAKKRWREQIRQGKPTDPSKDPDYDFVMSGEMVEPRDGPRAEWRHLWMANRQGSTADKLEGRDLRYATFGNTGMTAEDNEGVPEPYPGYAKLPGAEKYLVDPNRPGVTDQTKPFNPKAKADEETPKLPEEGNAPPELPGEGK